MANTRSAAKQARASLRRRERNRTIKVTIKKLERQYRKLVADNKIKEAGQMLPKVVSALDKAAKRRVIHNNKAKRKNSRLALLINNSQQTA